MLTPPTLVRRWPISLVSTVAAVTFTAGMIAGLLVEPPAPPPPPAPERICNYPLAEPAVIRALPTGASLSAKVASRSRMVDMLSPGAYVADGALDEVLDIELHAPLAVRHIFVNGNGGSHQWDTVIGDESIPFGRVYGGHRGDATWHVGVSQQGVWLTNPTTGALPELAGGSYTLELIGNGVDDGPGPRTVTVMFVDGTTITAPVDSRTSCYGSQRGGCSGQGNAN